MVTAWLGETCSRGMVTAWLGETCSEAW